MDRPHDVYRVQQDGRLQANVVSVYSRLVVFGAEDRDS